MSKINIALVDDHKLFRSGLKAILELVPNFNIIFESSNGQEFLDHEKLIEVDVVLLDIQMPVLNGIETTKILVAKQLKTKILILSMHDEDQFIMHLMELGVNGYLLKDTDSEDVIKAIHKVHDSGIYFSDFVSRILLRKIPKSGSTSSKIFNYKTDISDRELEVLRYICEGFTTTEIGDKICLSPRTVEGHRTRLMEKLDVNNTAKLVATAIKNQLVNI